VDTNRVSVHKGADARLPAQRHSHSMAKPGNAADVPLWAKPQRGRAFAPLVPRCTSLIGNSRICLGPTSLGAPCTRERKDPGAIAAIVQTFPRQPLIYSGRSRLGGKCADSRRRSQSMVVVLPRFEPVKLCG